MKRNELAKIRALHLLEAGWHFRCLTFPALKKNTVEATAPNNIEDKRKRDFNALPLQWLTLLLHGTYAYRIMCTGLMSPYCNIQGGDIEYSIKN